MALLAEYSSQELLQAQLQLWNQSLGFFKSAALTIAIDLRVADASINPCRLRDLRRVMRVLTASDIFSVQQEPNDAAAIYRLTAASRLLVREKNTSTTGQLLAVEVELFLVPCRDSPVGRGMRDWFRLPQDEQQQQTGLSPFSLAFGGQTIWERAERDAAAFPFDDAMASDTAFLVPIVLRECGDEVFQGLTSLVDVAGGLGGAATAIAAAFPDMKCTVLDLPQVVAKAPIGNNVQYVAGDMFESIPTANAVFLKILKNCKQAIPPRDAGGKVIIIDMVVGYGPSQIKHVVDTQVLYDLLIMNITGVERDKQEWKKIIFKAGFEDYKIIPVLGVRSIIELYP